RSLGFFACASLIISLVTPISAQIRATEKPFLWRIDGPVPSYLYGTVHVPDPRVLELPEVVRRALDASDVFNAEIPLDGATQLSMMSKIMLPPGQDLRSVVGEDVFARVIRVVGKVLGSGAPPGAADVLAMMLAPMKPWAVMSQVELLEFLPDISAGRQPLDAVLYGIAGKAGKELGALETLDEQIAVFEGFTKEEQVKMLVSTLDDLEKPRPGGISPARELVDLYLTGDLNRLAAEMNKQYPNDQALNKKMITRVVDDRNTKMAEKIAQLCAKKPVKSYFFAVGALHYAGDTGIVSQLTRKGYKITRLSPNDATSIVRKPAA
ncbi:MAG TPA: TraB/GumN family protein, partial [Acidobacteriota bacterium]|nr:TraB/GumN family protein [Acidobacteriota bacterium]